MGLLALLPGLPFLPFIFGATLLGGIAYRAALQAEPEDDDLTSVEAEATGCRSLSFYRRPTLAACYEQIMSPMVKEAQSLFLMAGNSPHSYRWTVPSLLL